MSDTPGRVFGHCTFRTLGFRCIFRTCPKVAPEFQDSHFFRFSAWKFFVSVFRSVKAAPSVSMRSSLTGPYCQHTRMPFTVCQEHSSRGPDRPVTICAVLPASGSLSVTSLLLIIYYYSRQRMAALRCAAADSSCSGPILECVHPVRKAAQLLCVVT
jgi:hypothetical protein